MSTLTPVQYERLPELARTIVDFDREVAASAREPVVPLGFHRELLARRRELGQAAGRVWGLPLGGKRHN